MKFLPLIIAAALLGTGTAVAGNGKMDAQSRQLLDMYKAGTLTLKASEGFITVPASRGNSAMADVLVETTDQAVLDSLESCGYEVEYISPSFSVVHMEVDGIEQLSLSPSVATLSFGRKCEVAMDEARGASRVNTVHSGLGISYNGSSRHPFKGEGVIVGMFDTGFDPSHLNFLSADGRECRIKFYARYSGSSTSASIYTDDKVRTAPTDDANETHGTHVAGIMGGAYNGAGFYLKGSGSQVSDAGSLPLYGVAPEADLAICAGPLYDNSILAGIRRLINFANSQGKPLVVNLSLGNNYGPHDGSDAFSRSLDELAREAIICVAAGNEGGDYIHAGKTFSSADMALKVLLNGNRFRRGLLDIWSSTSDEITVSVVLVRPNTGEIVCKIPSQDGRTITCGSGEGDQHSIFRNAFGGTVTLTAAASGNRYNVAVRANDDVAPLTGTTDLIGIMIEGKDGVRVDAYGNGNAGISFTMAVPNGFDRPDNDGSINGMGCGFNTIVVGAYGTRGNWYDLKGNSRPSGVGSGALAGFSSWGNLVDGRKLPHITAPGAGIISSYSGPYVNGNYDETAYMLCATADEGATKHYWGAMNGTSMATPYVTGSVGLWLQADPNLTAEKAREIMMTTATTDSPVSDAVAWGAGKINVAQGIKEVIKTMGGVGDISAEASKVFVSCAGRTIDVVAAGADAIESSLYNTAGMLVATAASTGGNLQLTAPGAGLYIVNVKAGATVESHKVVVR